MSVLAILGASGHGKVIADAALHGRIWKEVIFFDDAFRELPVNFPWPVLGDTNNLIENLSQFSGVIVGIGNNLIREKKYQLLINNNAPIVTVIHPQAYISPLAEVGDGCVVFAQAAINVHACIGYGCIVNTGATVDHDCKLSNFVHISPGSNLGGMVVVGERSWLGIGSSVKQGVKIGSDVVVGAGSSVVKSIIDNQVVVGVPARPF